MTDQPNDFSELPDPDDAELEDELADELPADDEPDEHQHPQPDTTEPYDGCPACAAAAGTPASPWAALPDDLTLGLTIWGPWGGAQMRLETQLIEDAAGNPLYNADGTPALGAAEGSLALGIRDDAPRAGDEGDGITVYRLDAADARALRDLLNIATARHFI